MVRQGTTKPAHVAELQAILADNVRLLMQHRFREHGAESNMIEALRKKSGVGKGTIQRIFHYAKPGTSYPGIDKVALLARALGVTFLDLFTSNYAARLRGEPPPPSRTRTAA